MPFRWGTVILAVGLFRPTQGMVLSELYTNAHQVRCSQGHEAARLLYQTILMLQNNPSDGTTATRLAASPHAVSRLERIGRHQDDDDDDCMAHTLRELLQKANYTSASVGALLTDDTTMSSCPCPVYVNPAAAGSAPVMTPTKELTPLQVLVSLFLLGLAVPVSALPNELLNTGLVFPCDFDSSLAIAYVSLYPLDVAPNETLYFMTDWHPKVLCTTCINSEEEPVMYIGPDSLALVHHFLLGWINNQQKEKNHHRWLDLCTGSGIQAIVAASLGLCQHVVCVDVNTRALRFARFNAALNGVNESHISFVQADLLKQPPTNDTSFLASGLLRNGRRFQVITANPPFLPVPPTLDANRRHGLFSSGGPSGDAVLQAVLCLAHEVLEENGTVAIVSEFCFGREDDLFRLSSHFGKGLLLTNQYPLSAVDYAKRRADSKHEFHVWKSHLVEQEIDAVSPGLLYVQKTSQASSWKQVKVPKSSQGSIWTPWNTPAVHFTRKASNDYFGKDLFQY